jgi:hypothetical protein
MTTLNEVELREIIQSDFKLWEMSETKVEGTNIVKTITLPHGIGEFSLTFEGVHDAKSRRGAVEYWGAAIRDAVDNVISDEAVEARAAQALARNRERDSVADDRPVRSGDTAGVDGPETKVDQAPDKGPEETFTLIGASPADIAGRLDAIRGEQQRLRERLIELEQEGRGLVAYLEAIGGLDDEVSESTTEAAMEEDIIETVSEDLKVMRKDI